MADLEHLISTNKLKTNRLKTFGSGKHWLYVKYDAVFDALVMLFVPPETEVVVHYVDDYVGLLYTPDDLEIVGLQVEAFEHSFLAAHDSVNRAWRLRDSCEELKDVGDIILAFEKRTPQVAQEVTRVTAKRLGKPGKILAEAVQHAYA
jgi:hypothetical protein